MNMYGQKGQAIVHCDLNLMSVVPESGHSIKEKISEITVCCRPEANIAFQ
jgi:hypothetical protein